MQVAWALKLSRPPVMSCFDPSRPPQFGELLASQSTDVTCSDPRHVGVGLVTAIVRRTEASKLGQDLLRMCAVSAGFEYACTTYVGVSKHRGS